MRLVTRIFAWYPSLILKALSLTVPIFHLLQCTLDHKHPSSKDNVLDWKQSRITAQVITYYGF